MSTREKASSFKDTNSLRIYDRNLPTFTLEPYLSFTSISTKCNNIDIKNHHMKRQEDIKANTMEKRNSYNQHKFFNPGSKAPWKGYSENVNDESILRNQVYALQKCSQVEYVPSSNSDLFQYNIDVTRVNQTHSLLFKEEQFEKCDPNPEPNKIGNGLFMNHTRNQLRGL
jgi:hypothetical protein